jgi:hypothetical protein
MENIKQKQREALQNAANVCGLIIVEWYYQDKGKASKFGANLPDGYAISPTLDYNEMNLFLLGFNRCQKFYTKPPKPKPKCNP